MGRDGGRDGEPWKGHRWGKMEGEVEREGERERERCGGKKLGWREKGMEGRR